MARNPFLILGPCNPRVSRLRQHQTVPIHAICVRSLEHYSIRRGDFYARQSAFRWPCAVAYSRTIPPAKCEGVRPPDSGIVNNKELMFVSLGEVLLDLEQHILIPEFVANLPGCDAEWLIKGRDDTYRGSEAASMLYQAIGLDSEGVSLRWFATGSGPIQRPLPTEAAKSDGMTLLRERIDWYGGWVARHKMFAPALFDQSRWSGAITKPHFAESFDEIERFSGYVGKRYGVSELGFDRAEIVAFLDLHEISHSLQVTTKEGAVVQSKLPSGLPTPDMAASFAGLGTWGVENWVRCLNETKWPEPACMKKGVPGRRREGAALWDPIRLAQLVLAREHCGIDLNMLGRRFRRSAELQPWLSDWVEFENQVRWFGEKPDE